MASTLFAVSIMSWWSVSKADILAIVPTVSPVPVSITSPTANLFSAFGSSSLPASVGIVVVLSAAIAPLTKTVVP